MLFTRGGSLACIIDSDQARERFAVSDGCLDDLMGEVG